MFTATELRWLAGLFLVVLAIATIFIRTRDIRKKLAEAKEEHRKELDGEYADFTEEDSVEFMARIVVEMAKSEKCKPVSRHYKAARDIYMRDTTVLGITPLVIEGLFGKVKKAVADNLLIEESL